MYRAIGFHPELPGGRQAGQLSVTSAGLIFALEGRKITLPLAGLEVRLGGASDRLLYFSHPSVPDWIITSSESALRRHPVLLQNERIAKQLALADRTRYRTRALWAGCAVLVVAIPLLLILRMNWVSGWVVSLIPYDWEQTLGASGFGQVTQSMGTLEDPAATEALHELMSPLLETLPPRPYSYQAVITRASEVNAFALPGGYIVVNAGLILQADTAAELQGVLAHELSHVISRHGLRNVVSTLGVFAAFQLMLGDAGSLAALAGTAAPLLLKQSYSRSFEAEADAQAVRWLVAARIDPRGLKQFFEKLRALETMPGVDERSSGSVIALLRSHPATEDRIARLDRLIAGDDRRYRDDQAVFEVLRARVKDWQRGDGL